MELHIIRHGVTTANESGILQGWTDSSLLPEQVTFLQSIALDVTQYDAIYASDLGRCAQTCSALRLPGVIVDQRLRERHFGVFEDLYFSECKAQYPDVFAQFETLSSEHQVPDGETRTEHFERLSSWIKSVQSCDRVLAVSHGGTVDFLYRLGTGRNLHGGEELFAGRNAARSGFRVDWPEVELISFNEHLGTGQARGDVT
jgi:probable phosphoglycerate mutase